MNQLENYLLSVNYMADTPTLKADRFFTGEETKISKDEIG